MIEESDGEVEELLRLRLLMAKTSVKKYEAIERSVCSDGRVHGLLQFYGSQPDRAVGRRNWYGPESAPEPYREFGTRIL